MTLEQFIESEAQRLFAALGVRHGRDIDFYRLMARRCIAPTEEQMQDALNAVRRVEEFLGRDPVHVCFNGMEGLEHGPDSHCKKSPRQAHRSSRPNVAPHPVKAKPH